MDEPEPDDDAPPADDQPVTELVGDLAIEVATLVKQELALAVAEMERKGRDAVKNVSRMVVGAALGGVALLVLLEAVVLGLGTVIPLWASAGIVALVIGVAAYVLFQGGRSALRAMTILPTETFASLQDDQLWAKEQIAATRDQMSATLGEVRRRLELAPAPAPAPAPKKKRAPAKRKRPPAE